MIQFLSTLILAFIFMPGVLYKIPKGYPLIVIAGIHAVLFAIVYMLMQKYVFDNYVEGMSPGASESDASDADMKGITRGNDENMTKDEKKVSELLSKLSVETTKELSKLSPERTDALIKLIQVMDLDNIDNFVKLPADKILEMIDQSLK